MNQQQSEHDEVDVMKEKADSTGKVTHSRISKRAVGNLICNPLRKMQVVEQG